MPMVVPGLQRLRGDRRGAVFVEFLIAFLPVQVFFLCLMQSAILYSVRLVTEHAALNAARAAAVVIGDDPAQYGREPLHTLRERNGSDRRKDIRKAALLTLAPLILRGQVMSVDVMFPEPERPDGPDRTGQLQFSPMNGQRVNKVRVRVEVDAACRIGFASQLVCGSLLNRIAGSQVNQIWLPTRKVRAEAIYPYQGASYAY